MKIGYICNQANCVSGVSNGIRMQAMIWRDALIEKGHDVELINSWGDYDWNSFDLVHSFGFNDSISFLGDLKKRGVQTACSPIIDTIQSQWIYKIASKWGSERLRLFSPGFYLRSHKKDIDIFFARSNYEASYINYCFDVPLDRIEIVPLSYRTSADQLYLGQKEDFCFHVSSITQERKNVMRLIKAAIKYKFNLVLAGSTGTPQAFEPFKKLIDENDNIKCLGFITEEELESLYSRAKVFALPSINEGVGLVALEAAMHGCGVVLTNVGGPQEYYKSDLVRLVSPYSIDEIGESVLQALKDPRQPELFYHLKNNYALDVCIEKLIVSYNKLICRK